MDCSPPGSSVHMIYQARILEWVATSFSRDLSDPGIKLRSPALQVDSLLLSHQESSKENIEPEYYLGRSPCFFRWR